MKKLGLLLSLMALFLIGCGGPEATLEIYSAGTTFEVGENITFLMRTYDAGSSDITYQFKDDPNDANWDVTTKISSYYTTSFNSPGTKTVQGRFFDGTEYSNIAQVTVTIESGTTPTTNPFDDDGTPSNQPVHTGISASTFWAGEGASGANHDISNVPSAWDNTWGDKFGVEDWPGLARNYSTKIPTDPRYRQIENPYYFALPYNDVSDLVFDGSYNQSAVAALHSDYSLTYDAGYGRNIVKTTSMNGGYDGWRKSSIVNIPWKDRSWPSMFDNWSGKSMCKGRWARIRYNGIDVYAQWMDAGPYYYDDYEYVFGTSTPRNQQNGYSVSPNAGIDLSPSVMLRLGVDIGTQGANIHGVEWQFVNANQVPEGPWRLYPSNSETDW